MSQFYTTPPARGSSAAAEAEPGRLPVNPQGSLKDGTSAAAPAPREGAIFSFTPLPLCPDLFGLHCLGEADGLRGHIVRAFAWLMGKVWPTR